MDEIKTDQKQMKYCLRKGYWSYEILLDHFAQITGRFPDREYVVDNRGDYCTYREMDILSSKVTTCLRDMEVEIGDCIPFQMPVWSELIVIALGCMKAGVVMHPITICYEEPDLIHAMNKADTKIFLGTV